MAVLILAAERDHCIMILNNSVLENLREGLGEKEAIS